MKSDKPQSAVFTDLLFILHFLFFIRKKVALPGIEPGSKV